MDPEYTTEIRCIMKEFNISKIKVRKMFYEHNLS